jgi:WD40 repeat protein
MFWYVVVTAKIAHNLATTAMAATVLVLQTQARVLREHTGYVASVAFSPNSQHIVSGSYDATMRVWGAANGECLHVFKGRTSFVMSLAFSPNGQLLASGGFDKR